MERAGSVAFSKAMDKLLLAVVCVMAWFVVALNCAVAQDAKPVAEQKAERPKFDYERYGVHEYLGLTRESGYLEMKFYVFGEDVSRHSIASIFPSRLQVRIWEAAPGTVLSYDVWGRRSLLELPTEEAAGKWRTYLEALQKSCLYVFYPRENDWKFVFADSIGTRLEIQDNSSHVIPGFGTGKIHTVIADLCDIHVVVENGVKTHFVVEWGKAFVWESVRKSSSDERYFELKAPSLTIYVPDSATQEAWQTRIEAERRKLAPHVVLPPAEVK